MTYGIAPDPSLPPQRTGPWLLSQLKHVPSNGLKVFSCFHCGGGSTMGYKLAGYEVIGGVDIDPQMMAIYRKNHAPKHSYLMGVQDFMKLPDSEIPDELRSLDVLDGSPPCSSFSTAGAREKKWGKNTHFREGQAEQILDELFFHYIEIANRLRPKVVVAENVKGLILGNAKFYVKRIFDAFDAAGYDTQLFLLNASRMGVPQRRERTFFIARRRDLKLPKIELAFNEPTIPFSVIKEKGVVKSDLTELTRWLWDRRIPTDRNLGHINARHRGKPSNFNTKIIPSHEPLVTITSGAMSILYDEPRGMTDGETIAGQTFPEDYDFGGAGVRYVCGMSVPPRMMQRVSEKIAQILTAGSALPR